MNQIQKKEINIYSRKNPTMEDLETFFLQKIKPYEERIQQLEESEKSKELEIVTLKHAIQNLNRIIEQLKASQPAATKPGARPIGIFRCL